MNIAPEFQYVALNEQGRRKAAELAEDFTEFQEQLEKVVPPGRYLAIVKTKLEEACFFAKKGMATQAVNQSKEEK